MLKKAKEEGKLARGGDGSNQHKGANVTDRNNCSLSDLGITRKVSSRSQKLANIPEEKFETAIVEQKESGTLSRSGMLSAPVESLEAERRREASLVSLDIFSGCATPREWEGLLTGWVSAALCLTREDGLLPVQLYRVVPKERGGRVEFFFCLRRSISGLLEQTLLNTFPP